MDDAHSEKEEQTHNETHHNEDKTDFTQHGESTLLFSALWLLHIIDLEPPGCA
jgi:hypothetical protein